MVWLAGFAKPLSRLGLCRYEEWHKGEKLKLLLVGYNGARNTGADARVVALVRQLEEALGTDNVELTVMTLDRDNTQGYFPQHVRQFPFTTVFFWSLLRIASESHAAILCEGSTLTTTFAEALSVFFCEAAGIMRRQHKPCIAYGSEVGRLEGWLTKLSRDLCRDTYFIVRTEKSLQNLQALGLKGHVGTDTAWPFLSEKLQAGESSEANVSEKLQAGESSEAREYSQWALRQLQNDGWDGRKPLVGVAVLNPFCWPVRPSLWRWGKAVFTGDHSGQYDKMYFFSDSPERRQQFRRYLSEMVGAVRRYALDHDAFLVVIGMEKLDAEACRQFAEQVAVPYAMYDSARYDVFQMTALLRQVSVLVTSRYHAAVLSMARAIPLVAVSIDDRLDGVIREAGLADHFLHRSTNSALGDRISESLHLIDEHREEVAETIRRQQVASEQKVQEMSQFFVEWLNRHFS